MQVTRHGYGVTTFLVCFALGLAALILVTQGASTDNTKRPTGSEHSTGLPSPAATITTTTTSDVARPPVSPEAPADASTLQPTAVPTTNGHDWVDMEPLLRGIPTYGGDGWTDMYCQHELSSTCDASFYSDQESVHLATLYKGLLQQGWTLLNEETHAGVGGTPEYTDKLLQFVKINSSPDLPRRLHFLMAFEARKIGTYIMAEMQAWPEPKNPPLYPGAKQLQAEWQTHPTLGFPQLITTYTVAATKEQVLDYYLHKMVGDGWDFEGSSDSWIGFSFSTGPEQGIGGAADIEVMPVGDHEVKVKVTSHGGDRPELNLTPTP